MEKDEIVYTVAVDLLAPIFQTPFQDFIPEIDHAYRVHTAYTITIKWNYHQIYKMIYNRLHSSRNLR